MVLCTQCGYILHPEDARSHVCDPEEIPKKGEPLKPTVTKKINQQVV